MRAGLEKNALCGPCAPVRLAGQYATRCRIYYKIYAYMYIYLFIYLFIDSLIYIYIYIEYSV